MKVSLRPDKFSGTQFFVLLLQTFEIFKKSLSRFVQVMVGKPEGNGIGGEYRFMDGLVDYFLVRHFNSTGRENRNAKTDLREEQGSKRALTDTDDPG